MGHHLRLPRVAVKDNLRETQVGNDAQDCVYKVKHDHGKTTDADPVSRLARPHIRVQILLRPTVQVCEVSAVHHPG
jgi:hypothetical protein